MPEAYVFALANHVLYQHRLRQARTSGSVDILEVLAEVESVPENDPAAHAETQQRVEELEQALGRLSPRAQTPTGCFVSHIVEAKILDPEDVTSRSESGAHTLRIVGKYVLIRFGLPFNDCPGLGCVFKSSVVSFFGSWMLRIADQARACS